MPRDEYRRRRGVRGDKTRRRRSNTTLWLVVGVGGSILALFAIVCGLIVYKYDDGVHRAERNIHALGGGDSRGRPDEPIDREEFREMVMGKSAIEVEELLGEPDQTAEVLGGKSWAYRGVTRDPATGNVDDLVLLSFDSNGHVRRVTFR